MTGKSKPTIEEIKHAGMGFAAKLVLEKKYNQAKQVLTKVLEVSPNDAEIMTLMADVYHIEGKVEDSKAWLKKAFSINPDYPKAHCILGVLHHEAGNYEKAIDEYEKAIQHFPETGKKDIADVYQNLGCALWETRRRDEALDAWKTCLKYDPKQKYAKRNLKNFTNEYRMGRSPVGMDDFWAFVDMKQSEYLSIKGRKDFNDLGEGKEILQKIMDAWNAQIAPEYGKELDDMKTEEKIKIFKEVKVFE
jgi:tetratricopeptide (TPR) repeat protein